MSLLLTIHRHKCIHQPRRAVQRAWEENFVQKPDEVTTVRVPEKTEAESADETAEGGDVEEFDVFDGADDACFGSGGGG